MRSCQLAALGALDLASGAHYPATGHPLLNSVSHGCPVGRLCHLEVVHTSDVLDDAVAGVVPDVHAVYGQVRLDSSWPAAIYSPMLSRTGFIEPCLPSSAEQPPNGPGWIHEIKHDGYRLMARRDPAGIQLLTRNGHDWTGRFPLIARAALSLKAAPCLIDGEAVAVSTHTPLGAYRKNCAN